MKETYFREIRPGYLRITKQEIPFNCPGLKTQLKGYLSRLDNSVKELVLNFSCVREVKSSCPAILIQLLAKVKKKEMTLTLEGITEQVASQIEINKLGSILKVTFGYPK